MKQMSKNNAWLEKNRDNFRPALDVVPHEFLKANNIKYTKDLLLFVVDAREPYFDQIILY